MQQKIEEVKNNFLSLNTLVDTIDFPNDPISDRAPNDFPVIYKEDIKLLISDVLNKLSELQLLATFNENEEAEMDRLIYTSSKIQDGLNVFKNFSNSVNSAKGLIISITTLHNVVIRLNSMLSLERISSTQIMPKSIKRQIDVYVAKIAKIDNEFNFVDEKIKAISEAYDASLRLPETKESLEETESEIKAIYKDLKEKHDLIYKLLPESENSRDKIQNLYEISKKEILETNKNFQDKSSELTDHYKNRIDEFDSRASVLLDKCDKLLRGSTSYGLAGAFNEKAKSLKWSIRLWSGALAGSLGCAGLLGYIRLSTLEKIIQNGNLSPSLITIEILISIASILGPLWFAWIATKQISQRFKLAEDYDFKASISKAYEGYREESIDIDPEFRERLFDNALTRLEEIPLRYVSNDEYSSPLMEIMNSPVIKGILAKAGETPKTFMDKILSSKEKKKKSDNEKEVEKDNSSGEDTPVKENNDDTQTSSS